MTCMTLYVWMHVTYLYTVAMVCICMELYVYLCHI